MNRVLQGERAPDGFALATGSLICRTACWTS